MSKVNNTVKMMELTYLYLQYSLALSKYNSEEEKLFKMEYDLENKVLYEELRKYNLDNFKLVKNDQTKTINLIYTYFGADVIINTNPKKIYHSDSENIIDILIDHNLEFNVSKILDLDLGNPKNMDKSKYDLISEHLKKRNNDLILENQGLSDDISSYIEKKKMIEEKIEKLTKNKIRYLFNKKEVENLKKKICNLNYLSKAYARKIDDNDKKIVKSSFSSYIEKELEGYIMLKELIIKHIKIVELENKLKKKINLQREKVVKLAEILEKEKEKYDTKLIQAVSENIEKNINQETLNDDEKKVLDDIKNTRKKLNEYQKEKIEEKLKKIIK